MKSRRHFLTASAAVPTLLAAPSLWAANDNSKQALVIGNSAYSQAPLTNPGNDARAMSGLLTSAGFSVDQRLDTTQARLFEAIDQFGRNVMNSSTKLALFYYAGHGAQLDWRNYLLPVDAQVTSPQELKQKCVDLDLLLRRLPRAKDKTFVIILDACRNNPFGSSYAPEQKGLSQFDAPVGSLLAYATSPGNVASDGSNQNGLYTEHLLRELSVRNTKIEDALKRVRLNVRLKSRGAQIPWETTSLEDDVYIFHDAQKKLSEAELEKLIEADMAEWNRIKSSRSIEDWTGYLMAFPNGRFAEIAQVRLNRLLLEREQANAAPAQAAPPTSVTAIAKPTVPQKPRLEIRPDKPMPPLMQESANPNSAGRYPLARHYTVGDTFEMLNYDLLTKIESVVTLRVTKVDPVADRVELNGGTTVLDTMGNPLKTPTAPESDVPRQFFPAELQVGKKWKASWKTFNPSMGNPLVSIDLKVDGFESVKVRAGEFKAFVISYEGWDSGGRKLRGKLWVVPGLGVSIKRESWITHQNRIGISEGSELISLTQQGIDPACAAPMETRGATLVVQNLCSS